MARRRSALVDHRRLSSTFFCRSEKNDCDAGGMPYGKVVLTGVTHRTTDPVRCPHTEICPLVTRRQTMA